MKANLYLNKYIPREFREIPEESRPREKLKKYGISSVDNIELMALMIGSGTKENHVLKIAEEVVELIYSKKEIPHIEDFLNITGIGENKAMSIIASLEFARRKWKPSSRKISSAKDAYEAIKHYGNSKQEYFLCLTLNAANEIINTHTVTIGILNRAIIHPREIFALAIEDRSNSIIIAHNHPSGNLKPGEDDISTTKSLVEAGKLLNIPILDHLIFTDSSYFSFLENHLMFD